jgi:hypothetical protein
MLSRPGQTTLIKSTLSAIPFHISIVVKVCLGIFVTLTRFVVHLSGVVHLVLPGDIAR